MKIIKNMPASEYFAAPGISASQLKRAGRTPAHFFAPPKEPTEAMLIGTAFHAHFLEGRVEYCSRPAGIDRRTKDGKDAYAKWSADNFGMIELPPDRCNDIAGAMNMLRNDDQVMSLFSTGAPEVSFFSDTGKCRADWYNADEDYIVDVKTTSDASPDGFMRQATNLEYWIQAAWYMRITGVSRFAFLAVELSSPYAYGIYEYEKTDIENAQAIIDIRLNRIEEFEAMRERQERASGSYGYKTITLPSWAIK
jgi:exodeoxyribonuclease VIII